MHAVLVTNQVLFVGLHLTGHAAMASIPPSFYTLMRVSIAVPLLALVARCEGPLWDADVRAVAPACAGLGFLGVGVSQWLVLEGNHRAGAAMAAALQPLIPVLALLLSYALRIEAYNWKKAVAIFVSVLGAIGLTHVDEGAQHRGPGAALGILALAIQVTAYSTFLVGMSMLLRNGRKHVSVRAFVVATFAGWLFLGLLNCVIVVHDGLDETRRWMRDAPVLAWLGALYAGVFVSTAAHSGQNWAIARAPSTTVALYGCIQPVLGIASAVVLFGDEWEARDFAFMAMVLAGVCGTAFVELQTSPSSRAFKPLPAEVDVDINAAAPAPDVEMVNNPAAPLVPSGHV